MKYFTLLALPLFLFITACGGGGNSQEEPTQEDTSQSSSTQQTAEMNDIRTIHIYGIDKMKYVVEENGKRIGTAEKIEASDGKSYLSLENIKAKAGEKLRVKLTTVSDLPESAMSHNWVLLNQSADPDAFASAALQAKDNDYIPADKTNEIIAHTDMASGGETVEVTFTVPSNTGDYEYLCSFPAHFSSGMRGTLIVESTN